MKRRDFLKNLLIIACSKFLPKIVFGDENKKEIYLTIDDGPGKNINEILANLGKKDKVTFFMVGGLMANQKRFYTSCKVLELGHEIGNHSYSHPRFSKISFEEAKKEIEKTHELIEKAYKTSGKINPLFFRFPYGDSGQYIEDKYTTGNQNKKEKIKEFIQKLGYTIYSWTLDSEDWKYYSKRYRKSLDEIMINIQQTQTEDIILTHDLSITATKIIPFYVSSGIYNLKTLKERS